MNSKTAILIMIFNVIILAEPITFSIFSDSANFRIDGVDFNQDLRTDFTVNTDEIRFFENVGPDGRITEGFAYDDISISYSSNTAGINSIGQEQMIFAVTQKTTLGGIETQLNTLSLSRSDLAVTFVQVFFDDNTLTSYDGVSDFLTVKTNNTLSVIINPFNDNLQSGENIEILAFPISTTFQAVQTVPEPSIILLLVLLSLVFFIKRIKVAQ